MCFNDFKLCKKNIFKNTRIHRVKYATTVRSNKRIASLCVYTNSSASATYLSLYCFQKELAWCSIYSYIRICIISYDELTRDRITPYPHTAARLHYLLWKQIVTNALTVFFLLVTTNRVFVSVCICAYLNGYHGRRTWTGKIC